MPRPTHARIDLEAIAHNVRAVKARIGPSVRLLVAVKADGYGHGAVATAQTALAHGAEHLGVATVEEGQELRRAGIKAPILVFSALGTDDCGACIKYRLTPALTGLDFARSLDRQARKAKRRVNVHVNVDTGMGRVGFLASEALDAVREIRDMRHLLLEGVMTHFPSADERDKTFTHGQIAAFRALLEELGRNAIRFPIVHTANSGAVIDVPESWFNMVRLGISLYGYLPSDETSGSIDLVPAMSVHSRIVHLKTVPAGTSISYGRTFRTTRETRVATAPVGYADGLDRRLSNAGKMIVHAAAGAGVVCPIIGRVCMDQTMLDVTAVDDASAGSAVTVYSGRRDDPNSVESTARLLGTIPHVVTCAVSKRVPRVYLPAHPPTDRRD
ncbi:MAG TPA: alanine racemase [Planctomycetota bacterium]|nr:alanine racemase [Planctomycetota bacterium]HUV38402.1 alanine racemase [Planctomycetota bacterium]